MYENKYANIFDFNHGEQIWYTVASQEKAETELFDLLQSWTVISQPNLLEYYTSAFH